MRSSPNGWSTLSLAAAAGLATSALAAPPAGNPAAEIVTKLPTPIHVDDPVALEVANKLGLNAPPRGALRGVTCDPIFDLTNCHIADLTLGANFSGAAPGSFRTMDNFVPSSNNPTQLCWIGRYADRVNPIPGESFQITIYASDIDGLPDLASGPIYQDTFTEGGGGCSADWDGSGTVNSNDISAFLSTWLQDVQNGTTASDFDGSGSVNSNDISAFLSAWLAQVGGSCTGGNVLEMACLPGDTCPGTSEPLAGGHWLFSVEVPGGFPVNANGCYWLEIANVGSNAQGVNWGWVGSTGGTDLFSLQAVDGAYTTFTRVSGDRSFCFSGGVNPNLGNCVLPPMPEICTNDQANGIPMNGGLTNGFRAAAPGSVSSCATLFQRAENFQFGAPTTVSNVCFGGFWINFNSACAQTGFNAPDNPVFVVNYYEDVNGFPAPVPMASFTTGDPGVTFIWDGEEIVSLDHPPVNFEADTCYYISIGTPQSTPPSNGTSYDWVWFLTFSSTPTGDNWVYTTTSTDPNGWVRFDISTPTQGGNLWFLFNAGPTTLPVCEPPPCEPSQVPANDLCVNAPLLAVPSTTFGTTICATLDGEPDCNGSASSAPGVWYRVIGTGGTMTASACTNVQYDGQMAVFSGGCGGLTCVGGGDDTCGAVGGHATVTWDSAAGVEYLIFIYGWGGATGDFQLDVFSN